MEAGSAPKKLTLFRESDDIWSSAATKIFVSAADELDRLANICALDLHHSR
jgi:hypothetical protein